MYLLGTNMYPLGVNKVQRCSYRKGVNPLTAFVPFFCVYDKTYMHFEITFNSVKLIVF